jgi:formate dehydrogenase iron-sulfur subunit
MDRRDLLKTMGVAAGAVLVGDRARGDVPAAAAAEPVGILVDTTKCIGCRMCELGCADAHKDEGVEFTEDVDFSQERTTSPTHWTVVNRYETDKGTIYAKKQCMHCLEPACASACLTKAMHKNPEGPVTWRGDRCMGCRFCMVSCPFDMPKFEYHSAVPRIEKCVMCYDRLQQGKQPACVENCPAGTLTFGKRADLLEEAKRRIYAEPDKYVHQVYGEQEVGGTGWMYLSAVPFEQLGFRTNVGTEPYPTYTREFLYSVPFVEILVPTFMVALSAATKREDKVAAAERDPAERKG